MPDVSFLPAMTRRRLSMATRIALRVAHDCRQNDDIGSAVFCSRHGECERTLGIYGALSKSNPMSPTQFSQSVHNTAAGVYSIEDDLHVNFCSMAAGEVTAEQGFIEAWTLIQSGSGPVLWVMSDAKLKPPYAEFEMVPELSFGVAMLLEKASAGSGLTLTQVEKPPERENSAGTDNVVALLLGQPQLALSPGNGWQWTLENG